MSIAEDVAEVPSIADIRDMVDTYKPLLQQLGAREAVRERWPEVGDWVFYSWEQVQKNFPMSDYGMMQWDEKYAWITDLGCVAPREALESGEFRGVWNAGWNAASSRFSPIRERYVAALSPDYLESAAHTADGMLKLKSLLNQMFDQHNDSGGQYRGEGRVEYRPGAFEAIEQLFGAWKGADRDTALEGFGDANQVAVNQLHLTRDLLIIAVNEVASQSLARTTVAEELSKLAEAVGRSMKDYDYSIVAAFNWTGVISGITGAGSALAESLEHHASSPISVRDAYEGNDPDKGWFTRFKEKMVVEIPGSLGAADADTIFETLEQVIGKTEQEIITAHNTLKELLSDAERAARTPTYVQGERLSVKVKTIKLNRNLLAATTLVTFLAAGCTIDSDNQTGPRSSPSKPESITVQDIFEDQDACEFFKLDLIREQIGIDQWTEDGSPEPDIFGDEQVDSCGATLPAVGRGHIPLLVGITIVDNFVSPAEPFHADTTPDSRIFTSADIRALDPPWTDGYSSVFAGHKSIPAQYEIRVDGIGDQFQVRVRIWSQEYESSVEVCPLIGNETGCAIDPYVLRDWLEYEYMPMIHEKITERLER